MQLPFSRDQFLDVFADYNDALWPLALALWLLTAAALLSLRRDARGNGRAIGLLLALQWLWAGVAYHAAFFSLINPAAWIFSALFLIEAGLLAWWGVVRGRIMFAEGSARRHPGAVALVAYALMYPALGWLDGLRYPWMPLFGVPCPTTILTIGFLLAANPPAPRSVALIPIVWAFIGGSAAFLLNVRADVMLLASGAIMIVALVRQSIRRWGVRDAELDQPLPGDSVISDPTYVAMAAVTINAPPEQIWPWLLQMGKGRGGLYSYDWLDRLFGFLDGPSADRILPEFQHLDVGDVIPIGGAAGGFPVTIVKPGEALVLGGAAEGFQWLWQLVLVPISDSRTRFISRNQARTPRSLRSFLVMLAIEPAAFIMTRKMLLGIKRRAEALRRQSGAGPSPLWTDKMRNYFPLL